MFMHGVGIGTILLVMMILSLDVYIYFMPYKFT